MTTGHGPLLYLLTTYFDEEKKKKIFYFFYFFSLEKEEEAMILELHSIMKEKVKIYVNDPQTSTMNGG